MHGRVVFALSIAAGVSALGGISALGCGFHAPADLGEQPDGDLCATACIDPNTLSVCSPDAASVMESCALGCMTGAPDHCGTLQPAGGFVVPADLNDDTTLMDIMTFAGTVDATSGAISGPTLRAAGEGVIAGIGFELREGIGVFRFGSLHVTGEVAIGGSNAVAFVALGDITVDDVIQVHGNGTTPGPGGTPGGAAEVTPMGSGAGEAGGGVHDKCTGGAGGGYGGAGGYGGTTASLAPPVGGMSFGDDAITTLSGGGGGGGGGVAGADSGGAGGGGGGAIQLVCDGTLTIALAGGINAGGGGGAGSTNNGGGGGGAGGTILLEANDIVIDGKLASNGGGGGAADAGTAAGRDGGNGALDSIPAGAGQGPGDGGLGAAGATINGAAGQDYKNGGGGGGAVGRIRINTRTGVATIGQASVISPTMGAGIPRTTQGKIKVQ